jgi:hypothetical protein
VQKRCLEGRRPFEELYDLQTDRDSVNNLAGLPAHAERLRTMRKALDEHMLAIVDNGFIPEGMPQEGYRNSRYTSAYPLARLMDLGAFEETGEPVERLRLVDFMRVLSSATVAEGAENQGHQRLSSATQDRIALPLRPRTWQCLDLRARFTPPASRSEVGDAQNANRFARRPLQQWPTLRWPRRRNRPTGRARRSAPDQVPARWT